MTRRFSLVFIILYIILCFRISAKQLNEAIQFSSKSNQKVLFIGNSYTSSNNLPILVSSIASSLNDTLVFDSHTPGGARLRDHYWNGIAETKINSNDWDYVVLQGQSQETSWGDSQVSSEVRPFAAHLSEIIKANNINSLPLFYMTWGRKNGDSNNCAYLPWVCTYEGMDDAIRKNYIKFKNDNIASVSPVGAVWRYLRENNPEIELYTGDGSHPSAAGSFAAASTFYAMVFKKDPTLSDYNYNLSETTASTIRDVVKKIVFEQIKTWQSRDTEISFSNYGLEVLFSHKKLDNETLSWDFGDGNISLENNPKHIYETEGEYTVTLTKSDSRGEEMVITKTLQLSNSTQLVNIPDYGFKSFLQENYPECFVGDSLDVICAYNHPKDSLIKNSSSPLINDLTGIEHFNNLTYIHFRGNNNGSSIKQIPLLPRNLKYAKLDLDHDMEDVCFPEGLETLDLSYSDILVQPNFPNSLRELYYQHAKFVTLHDLPDSLRILDISFVNNHLISMGNLPDSLSELYLKFNVKTISEFPDNLKKLSIINTYQSSLHVFPNSLEELEIITNYNIDELPQLNEGLEKLTFKNNDKVSSLPSLPSSIKELKITDNFKITEVPNLPSLIKIFECYNNNLTSLPSLPDGLEHLNSSDNNQLKQIPELPNSLLELIVNNDSLYSLPSLPSGLEILQCSNNGLSDLVNLPNSLIELNYSFNNEVWLDSFPQNIEVLEIENNNISCVPLLPSNLKKFKFRNGNNINCLKNIPVNSNISDLFPICEEFEFPENCSPPHKKGDTCEDPIIVGEGIHQVNNLTGDQWFKFVAPHEGNLQISTCRTTYENTLIKLFKTNCDSLIDTDDNSCYLSSEIELEIDSGDVYLIQLDDEHTSKVYDFSIKYLIPIGGETCEDAIVVKSGWHEANNENGTQWFSYKVPANGSLTISSCDSTAEDTYLELYNGCGSYISESDDDCGDVQSIITRNNVLEGEVYKIAWLDEYTDWQFPFEIDFTPDDPNYCDNLSNDTTLFITENEFYVFGEDTLTSTGTYQNSYVSSYECDSVVTLNLVIDQIEQIDSLVSGDKDQWIKWGQELPFELFDLNIDDDGSTYLTGKFNGTVDFDLSEEGSFTITNSNALCIVKYDNENGFVWAKSLGDNSAIYTYTRSYVAKDHEGNVFVVGLFTGTIDFDPGENDQSITATGQYGSGYILKLDQNGNYVWAKQLGDISASFGLEIDEYNDVYILGTNNATSLHLGKYDGQNGDQLITKTFDISSNIQSGHDKIKYENGEIIIMSTFSSGDQLDVDGNLMTLTPIGAWDLCYFKVNTNGIVQWVNTIGSSSGDYVGRIDIDSEGNIITSGFYKTALTIETQGQSVNLPASSYETTFIIKVDNDGNNIWAKHFNGRAGRSVRSTFYKEWANGLVIDPYDNIYITGKFSGNTDFNPGAETFNLRPSYAYSSSGYVTKLNSDGSFGWARIINKTAIKLLRDENGFLYRAEYSGHFSKLNTTSYFLEAEVLKKDGYQFGEQFLDYTGVYTRSLLDQFQLDSTIYLYLTVNDWDDTPGGDSCDEATEINENRILVDHYHDNSWHSELWYKFIATEAGALKVTSCIEADEDTNLKVYSSCGELYGSSDNDCNGYASEIVHYGLQEGDTVYINWLDTWADDWQDSEYFVKVDFLPTGSSCNNPIEISERGIYTADNSEGDQWYSYVAEKTGQLIISTTALANTTDTYIVLDDDCDPANGELSSNDNYAGVTSRIQYSVTEGQQYYIAMKAIYTNDSYPFHIGYSDDQGYACENPEPVDVGTIEVVNSLGSQFFEFETPAYGDMKISTCNITSEDTWILVYDENCNYLIDGDDDCDYQSEVILTDLNAGEKYIIEFWDDGYSNSYNFDLEFDEIDCNEYASDTTLYVSSCDSYDWNDSSYTETGSYYDTLSNQYGCDSLIILELTILESTTNDLTVESCDSYELNNETFTETGVYTQLLTNESGCDSTLTLNLTVLESTSEDITVASCDSYELNNETYTETGVYSQLLTNEAGCDSTLTLNLTILESTSEDLTVASCESYELNNETYTETGVYTQLLTNEAGCDSTLTLNLTILESTSEDITLESCDSYELNNETFTETGIYTQLLTNESGCDSTLILNLTILEGTSEDITVESCDSYELNNETYTETGIYTQLLTNESGCDSTLTLNLTILESTSEDITVESCDSYELNNETFTETGIYTQLLTNESGCDSTLILNLTILESTSEDLTVASCESYELNNETFTETGMYTQLLTNESGCDSTLALNLTILESTSEDLTVASCDSYELNNETYTESGIYTQLLTNEAGCDSTLTLNLTILESTSEDLVVESCDSYELNNETYTESGIYTQLLTNEAGCDSLLNLNLSIIPIDVGVTTSGASLRADELHADSYQWLNCDENTLIEGETKRVFTAKKTGSFAVVLTKDECMDTSLCYISAITSFENSVINKSEIKLYPNPTKKSVNIDLYKVYSEAEISIYSLLGEKLFYKKYKQIGSITLDLIQPKGLYILGLKLPDGTLKFIKVQKE